MPDKALTRLISRERLLEMVRYCTVGAATFVLFIAVSSIPKFVPAIPVGVASAMAVLLTAVFNFLAQYFLTFRSGQSLRHSGLRYALLVVFNSVWGGFLTSFLVHAYGMDTVLANTLCACAITLFSYPAMRYFVM